MQWHLKLLLLLNIWPGANGALQFSRSALFSVSSGGGGDVRLHSFQEKII